MYAMSINVIQKKHHINIFTCIINMICAEIHSTTYPFAKMNVIHQTEESSVSAWMKDNHHLLQHRGHGRRRPSDLLNLQLGHPRYLRKCQLARHLLRIYRTVPVLSGTCKETVCKGRVEDIPFCDVPSCLSSRWMELIIFEEMSRK
jgi:hypothetical protein